MKRSEGSSFGSAVGCYMKRSEGSPLGSAVGYHMKRSEGSSFGSAVGCHMKRSEGSSLGYTVGCRVGRLGSFGVRQGAIIRRRAIFRHAQDVRQFNVMPRTLNPLDTIPIDLLV
jgi:hypothetical protein